MALWVMLLSFVVLLRIVLNVKATNKKREFLLNPWTIMDIVGSFLLILHCGFFLLDHKY